MSALYRHILIQDTSMSHWRKQVSM